MTDPTGNLKYSPGDLVLVTGASGTIGPTLIQKLLDMDLKVRVFCRNPLGMEQDFLGVEIFQGDIRDIEALRQAMIGVKFVFHLAAKLHIYNPSQEDTAEYQQINVDGTRNVVLSAVDEKVNRLVFFSTINVYGPGEAGILFTEKSALRPLSVYSQTKVDAEAIIKEETFAENGESWGVILRLAAVYGPQMKGNYLHLLRGLKDRWFIPVGKGENRRSLINIHDVVNAAVLAAFHPAAGGKVYNLTDGKVYALQDVIKKMCQVLNRNVPKVHLPAGPVKFLAGLMEDLFSLINLKFPLNRNLINAILEDRAVSSEFIQIDLGFIPSVSMEEGWSEIVKSLGMKNPPAVREKDLEAL